MRLGVDLFMSSFSISNLLSSVICSLPTTLKVQPRISRLTDRGRKYPWSVIKYEDLMEESIRLRRGKWDELDPTGKIGDNLEQMSVVASRPLAPLSITSISSEFSLTSVEAIMRLRVAHICKSSNSPYLSAKISGPPTLSLSTPFTLTVTLYHHENPKEIHEESR
jgi:hypothetical protein